MMKKHKNLQPWLDYFAMLRTYEEKGFLYVNIERQEVYVTQPALLTLTGCKPQEFTTDKPKVLSKIGNTILRLCYYCEWKTAYTNAAMPNKHLSQAVICVKHEDPHDPVFTILRLRKRAWWKLWLGWRNSFEVILAN